jgi:hypothetical protein
MSDLSFSRITNCRKRKLVAPPGESDDVHWGADILTKVVT